MAKQKSKSAGREAEVMEELIAWLKEKTTSVRYGEVGLILTKHQGKITHCKKVRISVERLSANKE